jgi:hypothetical protein
MKTSLALLLFALCFAVACVSLAGCKKENVEPQTKLKSVIIVPVCPPMQVETITLTKEAVMQIYKSGYCTGVEKGNLNSFSCDSLEIINGLN